MKKKKNHFFGKIKNIQKRKIIKNKNQKFLFFRTRKTNKPYHKTKISHPKYQSFFYFFKNSERLNLIKKKSQSVKPARYFIIKKRMLWRLAMSHNKWFKNYKKRKFKRYRFKSRQFYKKNLQRLFKYNGNKSLYCNINSLSNKKLENISLINFSKYLYLKKYKFIKNLKFYNKYDRYLLLYSKTKSLDSLRLEKHRFPLMLRFNHFFKDTRKKIITVYRISLKKYVNNSTYGSFITSSFFFFNRASISNVKYLVSNFQSHRLVKYKKKNLTWFFSCNRNKHLLELVNVNIAKTNLKSLFINYLSYLSLIKSPFKLNFRLVGLKNYNENLRLEPIYSLTDFKNKKKNKNFYNFYDVLKLSLDIINFCTTIHQVNLNKFTDHQIILSKFVQLKFYLNLFEDRFYSLLNNDNFVIYLFAFIPLLYYRFVSFGCRLVFMLRYLYKSFFSSFVFSLNFVSIKDVRPLFMFTSYVLLMVKNLKKKNYTINNLINDVNIVRYFFLENSNNTSLFYLSLVRFIYQVIYKFKDLNLMLNENKINKVLLFYNNKLFNFKSNFFFGNFINIDLFFNNIFNKYLIIKSSQLYKFQIKNRFLYPTTYKSKKNYVKPFHRFMYAWSLSQYKVNFSLYLAKYFNYSNFLKLYYCENTISKNVICTKLQLLKQINNYLLLFMIFLKFFGLVKYILEKRKTLVNSNLFKVVKPILIDDKNSLKISRIIVYNKYFLIRL